MSQIQAQFAELQELTYAANPSAADEAHGPDGEVKPHWVYLLDSLRVLGPAALADRHTKAHRILRDDGATYDIGSDIGSQGRTWELDLVPSLISSEEWARIEAGLLERAELFDLLLKDLYGPRSLLRTRVIPPEALFSHAGFLRACQGMPLPTPRSLLMHAVDLFRAPDGELCVLDDRTQVPSGAGYALENRTVMSRILPSLFRDSHVHRLAGFFQHLRMTLNALAPQDQPRIVVLTPGSHSKTYFEHAHLANYLGFRLVQSGDLVVMDGYVWMKSLEGLSRVDVILRQVEDSYCDPVELRNDSQFGVPNLMEVVRAGRVAICNPIGVGALENPILLKYMPEIARALLGREPRLRALETYWCGNAQDMAYVQDHLEHLMIKPAFRGGQQSSINASLLSRKERDALMQRLHADPLQYVAQPLVQASTLPTFADNQLVPRPAILRSFAVASQSSYLIMPGGLTRSGLKQPLTVIANQQGTHSKDTWVIASEPERLLTQMSDDDGSSVREADLMGLPSRVVENMFWMGRYAERAEASMRLLRTVFVLINGEEPISQPCRRILLETVSHITATTPGFVGADDAAIAAPEAALLRTINDTSLSGSVRSTLNAMLYCAEQSKEMLSSDMLRVINDISDALQTLDADQSAQLASAPEEALDPLVTALMALAGLANESMVRGYSWRFMEIGRRLERAQQTTAILRHLLLPDCQPHDQQTLISALLLTLESLISYRRRYRAQMSVRASLELVLMDRDNPRSLHYQINTLHQHILALPKSMASHHELLAEERSALQAETLIRLSVLSELSVRENGKLAHLAQNLETLKHLLDTISNAVSDKYFDHRESSQQLVHSIWEND